MEHEITINSHQNMEIATRVVRLLTDVALLEFTSLVTLDEGGLA